MNNVAPSHRGAPFASHRRTYGQVVDLLTGASGGAHTPITPMRASLLREGPHVGLRVCDGGCQVLQHPPSLPKRRRAIGGRVIRSRQRRPHRVREGVERLGGRQRNQAV
jgi:hypothetical protein